MIKTSEIKQVALNQLKGKLSKSFAIATFFTLVNVALSYALVAVQNATTHTPILYYSANIIYLAIFLPLSFGLISSMRKLIKGDDVGLTTFINDAILNSTKAISIFIRTLLKMLLPSIIIIIGLMGLLFLTTQVIPLNNSTASGYTVFIAIIYIIVFIGIALSALPYVLATYILVDNKELKSKELVKQSAALMENNKWSFIKLIISFLGWILLIAICSATAGKMSSEAVANYIQWFGMIFLMPYLISSISVFYEETLNSTEVPNEVTEK